MLVSATKSLFDSTPNLSQNDIDTVLVSTNENGQYLGPILSELAGIKPNISHKIENLCSSGASSIVSAYSYIASGLSDTVLVVGADRYDSPGRLLEWDDTRGEYKNPIFWASLFTKSYKRKFNLSEEELAAMLSEDDEDINRHCDFVDRWLEWNSQQEIWSRTMSSWKEIVGDEDPYLFHLSEESRQKLESAAKEMQDF